MQRVVVPTFGQLAFIDMPSHGRAWSHSGGFVSPNLSTGRSLQTDALKRTIPRVGKATAAVAETREGVKPSPEFHSRLNKPCPLSGARVGIARC
jgi:hypothetical protein